MGREEICDLLFKITQEKLPKMTYTQLQIAVDQTVNELDQDNKDGLKFREFKQIFENRQWVKSILTSYWI